MSKIYRHSELEFKKNNSPISDFSWKASNSLENECSSKYLHFDIKSLLPDKFSYPYHFHRNAEEIFVVLKGEATLRSADGYEKVIERDVIYFAEGPEGTHQLYNHSDAEFLYVDIRTKANIDVCEYPDSGKMNILPTLEIFMSPTKVPYYTDEENVRKNWPKEVLKKKTK